MLGLPRPTLDVPVSLPRQTVVEQAAAPTLSALAQGPGFANLSCLGEVSDRVLACYIDNGPADNTSADSEPGSDQQSGGEVRDEIHVG